MNPPTLSIRPLAALLVGVLVLLPACELQNPDALTLNDVITIELPEGTTSLKANGVAKVAITATLQGDTPANSDITFRTDAGTFASIPPETTSNPQEITVKAAGRQVTVFLVSSTKVIEATVSASVGDFTAFTMVPFDRVNPARLVLMSNTTSLMADGNDTAMLTVMLIPPEETGEETGTVSEGTRVLFEATFEGTTTTLQDLDREALSNDIGIATTPLVGRQQGSIRITATVEGTTAEDSVVIEFK